MDVTLLQCQQESTSAAEHQEAEPSCVHKALEDETNVEATKLPSQDVSGNATTVTSLTYSQLEGLLLNPDTNANQNGKDEAETPTVEFSRSSSQTHMESPQKILPASVVFLGSCTSASNEKKVNSQCYLERDHETKHKGCSDMVKADILTVMEVEVVGLPPKKKQRMGKCVLTIKGFNCQRNVKIWKRTMEDDVQKCKMMGQTYVYSSHYLSQLRETQSRVRQRCNPSP